MNEQENDSTPEQDLPEEQITGSAPSLIKRLEEYWATYAPIMRPGLMLVVFFAALWLLHA